MKLITLNTWGGRINGPLLAFIEKHADTDIFCLQEIYHEASGKEKDYHDDNHELFSDIAKILPDHEGFFHPHYRGFYGLAMFIRKNAGAFSVTEHFVHLDPTHKWDVPGEHPRNVQCAEFSGYAVVNFHGTWQKNTGKNDTPERFAQSEKLADVLRSIPGRKIIAGDFNLNPDTKSLQMIEECGFHNLITEYGITNTRTSYYDKTYSLFADYVLVSPGIHVKSFRVLPDEVSDHAALELNFEIGR
jgi:endonuclease/exonuclease/phosphatase family metal-dependent hydrolase